MLVPDKQQLKFSREFERAVLPVKGEISNTDGAGRAEDGGRQPFAGSTGAYKNVAVVGHLELGIVTEEVGEMSQIEMSTNRQVMPVHC